MGQLQRVAGRVQGSEPLAAARPASTAHSPPHLITRQPPSSSPTDSSIQATCGGHGATWRRLPRAPRPAAAQRSCRVRSVGEVKLAYACSAACHPQSLRSQRAPPCFPLVCSMPAKEGRSVQAHFAPRSPLHTLRAMPHHAVPSSLPAVESRTNSVQVPFCRRTFARRSPLYAPHALLFSARSGGAHAQRASALPGAASDRLLASGGAGGGQHT